MCCGCCFLREIVFPRILLRIVRGCMQAQEHRSSWGYHTCRLKLMFMCSIHWYAHLDAGKSTAAPKSRTARLKRGDADSNSDEEPQSCAVLSPHRYESRRKICLVCMYWSSTSRVYVLDITSPYLMQGTLNVCSICEAAIQPAYLKCYVLPHQIFTLLVYHFRNANNKL